ncbi:hypothetical protein HanIR_Chr08g0376581 [Helianthus annuus]|nr:hypothetical protein HanIR_Chr08g0376581 [Helianthus annuus]
MQFHNLLYMVDETEYVSSTRVFRRGPALFRRLLGFFRPNVWPIGVSPSPFVFRQGLCLSSINTPLSFCVKQMSTERLSESPLKYCLYMFVVVLIHNQ